jgi:hypothetical protein
MCIVILIIIAYSVFLSFLWNFLSGENERMAISKKRELYQNRKGVIAHINKEL